MMFIPFKDMMILHLLMGVGFTFFLALRSFQRHNNPPRRWFSFGGTPYSLGNIHKWVQWYCWAFVFEIVTSFLYAHTGMFYYELGVSIFEALALTVGGFIVDRLTGILFLVDENGVDGDIDLGVIPALTKTKEKILPKIDPEMMSSKPKDENLAEAWKSYKPKKDVKPPKEDIIAKENAQFSNIIKGH